eukprot:TRINITY_DN2408_c0_g1_i4.p1 TRINITY_DN2408_c0_g1~~TRINITY_DN2408_c0_g1_i4.p1  ORF type:complete len:653 (-),score=236.18 TRINITY_DN2408_c0_g1_i4:38-1996(-)
MDDFATKLKKMVKLARQIQANSTILSGLYKQFAGEMINLGNETYNERVKEGFQNFAQTINELEASRELLSIQIENSFVIPADEFVKKEVEDVKEKKKKYDRVNNSYNNALNKLSNLKKKEINALKTMETEHELNDSKRDYRIESLNFAFALNDMQAKKHYELLESSIAFCFAQCKYFERGFATSNELQNYMKELALDLNKEKMCLKEEKDEVAAYKKMLETTPTTTHLYIRNKSNSKTLAKTIQGYLFKKNASTISVRSEWQRRYFVVEGGLLTYYKTGKDTTPVLAINLLLCSVKEKHDIDRRFCFEVISPDKSFLLQAEDEEKMKEWICVIQNAISDLLNHQAPAKPVESNEHRVRENSSGLIEETKKTPATAFEQVRLMDPSNKSCADCDASDPDWASLNLGILMCIECSGVHRSMGVHISKVRSFTLDKWEPENIKFMLALGNEKVNEIYEESLPEGTKITFNSDKITREKFIKAKYQEKKFVARSLVDPETLNLNLFESARTNRLQQCVRLIAQGANVKYMNPSQNKMTPLHVAVKEGHLVTTVLLTQYKSDLNVQDELGNTPLHYAAAEGKTNIACYLFKSGAKLDPKNLEGKTALDVALALQQVHCVMLLRLAQMVMEESNGNSHDDSFSQALANFTMGMESEFE